MADTKIKTKNPGILEVPEDKKFWQLPLSYYEKLVDKKGYAKIIRALTNLEVWNKNDAPKISKKASDIADKLKKKYKKEALEKSDVEKYLDEDVFEISDLSPVEFKIEDTIINGYNISNLYIFTVEDYHKMCDITADVIASKLGDTFEKLFDRETAAELMKDDPVSFEAGLTLIEKLDEDEDFLYKFNEIEDSFIVDDEEYLILKED